MFRRRVNVSGVDVISVIVVMAVHRHTEDVETCVCIKSRKETKQALEPSQL